MNTKELLEKYDKITKEANKSNERALYCLLKGNEKYIEGLIERDNSGYRFHKAFRQTDVCESRYIDDAIWLLLNNVELFWEMLEDDTKQNIATYDNN